MLILAEECRIGNSHSLLEPQIRCRSRARRFRRANIWPPGQSSLQIGFAGFDFGQWLQRIREGQYALWLHFTEQRFESNCGVARVGFGRGSVEFESFRRNLNLTLVRE